MKRILKRTQWIAVVMTVVMGIPVMLYAGTSVIEELNVFSPNTVISSMKVNENFVMLDDRIATYEDAITVGNTNIVGIGTKNPLAPLHVQGIQGSQTQAIFVTSDFVHHVSGSGLSLGNGVSSGNGYSFIQAGANGSDSVADLVMQQYGGKVGIGTTAPVSTLTVQGSLCVTTSGECDTTGGNGTFGNRLTASRLSSSGGVIDLDAASGSNFFQLTGGVTTLYQSGVAGFSQKSGRIGIGTTAPAAKLQILDGTLNGESLRISRDANDMLSFYPNYTGYALIQAGSVSGLMLDGTGTSSNNQMFLRADGSVGIGTTSPSQKLHVVGKVTADDYLSNSDSRLKRDITPLENAADGITCLQGVTYRWEDPTSSQELQLGLIAQDVERCYPEVVSTDSKGFKSVSYARLVAPLIEAVKEQQTTISAQQLETRALRAALESTNARLARLEASLTPKR